MFKKLIAIAMMFTLSFAFSSGFAQPLGREDKVYYNIGDGKTEYAIIHEPPENWNAVSATDDELHYYGFPKRPSEPQKVKEWEKLVSPGKFIRPTFKKREVKLDIQANNYNNLYNWSGYARKCSTSVSYNGVQGNWTIPAVSAPTSYRPAEAVEWVGLGSYPGGGSLAQGGTVLIVNTAGNASYASFYEVINVPGLDSSMYDIGFSCSSNQTMYVQVSTAYISSNNTTEISFYYKNVTTGATTSFKKVASGNYTTSSYLGKSAEWIVERPTDVGTYYFPYFYSAYFSGCKYSSPGTSYSYLNNDNNSPSLVDNLTLLRQSTGHTLASPASINNPGCFYDYWYNYN